MLRLDPSAPPLWRDDATVQFGSPARAYLTDSAPWTDAALTALEAGTSRAALRALVRLHGGADRDADDLLGRLAPALSRRRRTPPLIVQVADDLPGSAVRAVLAALPPRTRRLDWAGRDSHPVPAEARVLLLAAHRVDPRRAVEIVRHDVVHLPLVLDGTSAAVGPLIAPGRTACLTCLDADRRRQDSSWPLIAAQLLARPRPAIDPALAAEAGRAARHLLSGPIDPVTRSLLLRVDSLQRVWRTHQPSEDCRCRSLGGSATASARTGRDRVTSSPTGFARPA
ncbi:hypothetical protein SRABI128_00741 [Microbacterium sp. Bi128]|nr:hypothetical protein SRABI128_00741 [Microbacterium sp. Bi128]